MVDLENLEDLYTFQEISKGNKNFQILFNRDLARKLSKIELTPKNFSDLKKSFIESGKLGKDYHFYNLMKERHTPTIYFGLLLDCRYDSAKFILRYCDLENLYLDNNSYVKYQSFDVKKDEQEKILKGLFLNYLKFVAGFIK